MLRSISLGRRRSSGSLGSGAETPVSVRTTDDMRPSSTRSTSDLKAAFLRHWRRSTGDSVTEMTGGPLGQKHPPPTLDPSANAVPSPLDDIRAARGNPPGVPREIGDGPPRESRPPLGRTTSDRGPRPSLAPGAAPGETTSDEVAGVIGSYGRQQ